MKHPTRPAKQAQAILRVGATAGVPSVLRDLGVDPARLITEAGLNPKIFDSPDNRLSLQARGNLVEHCAKVTGCPHFGLLAGQRVGLDSLGIVGLLVKHLPDVETSLRLLSRDFYLHAAGVSLDLRVDGGHAILSYGIWEPGVLGVDQTCDGALAVMLNVMRELCGPDFKSTEVWFARARPDEIEPYQQFFQSHLRFDAEINAMVFSSTWLSRRLPPTEPELVRFLQERVANLEQHYPQEFPDKVRSVMRSALAFDHVTADQMATLFSLHVRTYHRRLADCGTSHQHLLDQTRFAVACQLLEGTDHSVAAISELLDYAEPRSFNRAFLRWSGKTPSLWRKEMTMKTAHSEN